MFNLQTILKNILPPKPPSAKSLAERKEKQHKKIISLVGRGNIPYNWEI